MAPQRYWFVRRHLVPVGGTLPMVVAVSVHKLLWPGNFQLLLLLGMLVSVLFLSWVCAVRRRVLQRGREMRFRCCTRCGHAMLTGQGVCTECGEAFSARACARMFRVIALDFRGQGSFYRMLLRGPREWRGQGGV